MDHPTPVPFLGNLVPFEQTSKLQPIRDVCKNLELLPVMCEAEISCQGENIQNLIKLSMDARKNAYAPYSKFPVGAALLCKSGEIFQGCNVENSSYGLSICAELTAMVKAVSCGKLDICAIAVVADSDSFITTPCGRCRQFLNEFGTHIDVYCAKVDLKEVLITSISGLLPYNFHMLRSNVQSQ